MGLNPGNEGFSCDQLKKVSPNSCNSFKKNEVFKATIKNFMHPGIIFTQIPIIMKKPVAFILLLMVLGSCEKEPEGLLIDVSLINSWVLISLTNTADNQINVLPQELDYLTLKFVDSISLNAISVCNPGSGTYSIKNDSIMISIGFTNMECQNNIDFPDWDTRFISNLNQTGKFSISGDNLILYSDGDYNLNFKLLRFIMKSEN